MSELKIKMQNVEAIATLVIQQQKDFENHINKDLQLASYNEYMRLVWNLDSLKSLIIELEYELKNITPL
jgi:hypothetical protein